MTENTENSLVPAEEPAPPPTPPASPKLKLTVPLFLVLAGVVTIGALSKVEERADANQPWQDAVFAPDAPLPERDAAGIMPTRARRLPLPYSPLLSNVLSGLNAVPDGQEMIREFGLDKGEYVVSLPISEGELKKLLVSGRLPEPGKPEAVAGDLASRTSFTLDNQKFTVVGKLKRGVGALAYAYVIPENEALNAFFASSKDVKQGWIDPNGIPKLEEEARTQPDAKRDGAGAPYFQGKSDESPQSKRIGGRGRMLRGVSIGTILGLILVAVGGSWAQFRLMRRFANARTGWLRPALQDIALRPKLFIVVNVLLYGAFFLAMFAALDYPVANMRLARYVNNEFRHGWLLSDVGAAYASGEIWRAAAATFAFNYGVAVITFTLLPSLVIPFFGFVKTLFSFLMVGFAMSPLWIDISSGLTYHCITMTLEFEAYIVASFIVIVFPVRLVKGMVTGDPGREFSRGMRGLASTAVLAALMLAIAALYEATTLILLR